MTRSVFIVGAPFGYADMFLDRGWTVVHNVLFAELVQFTGGEDVDPQLYGEKPHPSTFCNPLRDKTEKKFFDLSVGAAIPMAGICRGGQFLNVMNGGKMWQHVDGHARAGTHPVMDTATGEFFQATSTHHQMMIPTKDAVVIGTAKESHIKERMRPYGGEPLTVIGEEPDTEIVFYPKTKSLCFQPHPEYEGHDELRNRYFEYIEEYCFSTEERKGWE